MKNHFDFSLTIANNALLCPNPSEWYTRAFVTETLAKNFRVIPGVKNSTKVATATFPSVLKAETCTWEASASNLSATTVTVCRVQAMTSICKSDILDSFDAINVASGSFNFTTEAFMAKYWEILQLEIQEEISYLMFIGDTAGTGTTYTGNNAYRVLCDGFEKKLLANTSVVDVTLTASTVANVISNLEAVIAAAPTALLSTRKADVKLYVASDVYSKFMISASKGNTINYVTAELAPNFAGYELVECPGMSSGKIIFTKKQNLVYAFDGLSDSSNIKAIDMTDTAAVQELRTAVWLSLGFEILDAANIVYFN